ncbi:hypothetical protein RR48_10754 [Papilio machaon]|uniref:Uncharacterized protein n=1 Tax=Papilio machaon TaxID=76193 RepID=A0A194R8J5_PAPMA|nr:hypothetical protein RR48_10754 [Papilio machaon]
MSWRRHRMEDAGAAPLHPPSYKRAGDARAGQWQKVSVPSASSLQGAVLCACASRPGASDATYHYKFCRKDDASRTALSFRVWSY